MLSDAYQPVLVPENLLRPIVNRLAEFGFGKPSRAVIPKRAEYRIARGFMETNNLGDDAEVANSLVQVKLVCHGGVLLESGVMCLPACLYITLKRNNSKSFTENNGTKYMEEHDSCLCVGCDSVKNKYDARKGHTIAPKLVASGVAVWVLQPFDDLFSAFWP